MSAACCGRKSIAALDLARHGLQIVPYGGGVTFTRDGDYLGGYVDKDVKRREIARHNAHDADAWQRYSRDTMRQCRFIRSLLLRTPPDPTSLKAARSARAAVSRQATLPISASRESTTRIRFYTLSIADYLAEYFESDLVRANFAGSGIIGTALGVHSPGTAYVLLHHYMGDVDGQAGAWGYARGGMGAVSQALASALQSFGGEIRCDAPVEQSAESRRQVTGVVLASGEEILADRVLSNLDPKRTFLGLLDQKSLEPDLIAKRAAISRSAAPPASSTSRSMACRNFRR